MQTLIQQTPARIYPFRGQSMEERDIKTLKEFHRVLRRNLKPSTYSVFCAIEDRAGPQSSNGFPAYTCFAAHSSLSADANVSRDTVIRALKELLSDGLITLQDREGETSLIWPIVTNSQWLAYIEAQANKPKKAKKNLSQIATGSKIIQELPQIAIGGVAKSYTNETTLTNQEKEKNTTTKVVGPTTIDLPDCVQIENLSIALTSRQEVSNPGSIKQGRGVANSSSSNYSQTVIDRPIKPAPKPQIEKPKKAPAPPNPFLTDPRLLKWREIAVENGYKYWPNMEQQKLIMHHIPENKVDRWEALIKAWLLKGHKVFNIEGMVKVYHFGFEAFYKGKADNKPLPFNQELD